MDAAHDHHDARGRAFPQWPSQARAAPVRLLNGLAAEAVSGDGTSGRVAAPVQEAVWPASKARLAGRGGSMAKASNAGAGANGSDAGVEICPEVP